MLILALAFSSDPVAEDPALSDEEIAALAAQRRPASEGGNPEEEVTTGISVISFPTEATVYVEFEPVGVSPLDAIALEAGSYFVSVSKPGYESLDTLVFVDRGSISPIYVVMQPDERLAGAAPGGVEGFAAGEIETSVEPPRTAANDPSRAQARDQTPTRTPAAEERPTAPRTSQPEPPPARVGGLRVASEPSGATVVLDGRSVGKTPLTLGDVQPERYALVLQKDGYTPYSERVTVQAGEEASLRVTLARLVGEVTVLVRPWGSIYVDGELRRTDTDVQYSAELPVGTHTIRATHPGLGTKERTVEVAAGGSQRIVIDLN